MSAYLRARPPSSTFLTPPRLSFPSNRFHLAFLAKSMSDPSRIVYLEDLEGPAVPKTEKKESSETTVASKKTSKDASKTTETTAAASLKRQRTLMEMFGGSTGAKSGESSTKKIKLATSGSSVEPSRTQSLNSIPFSLSGYMSSLSEEEKRLLALECETMGKSWYVPCLSLCAHTVHMCAPTTLGSKCSKTRFESRTS